MDHQEVQVQVEHLVQMDHQGSAGSSLEHLVQWIIRKCRIKWNIWCKWIISEVQDQVEHQIADGSSGSARFLVEHLVQMDHPGSAGSEWYKGSSGVQVQVVQLEHLVQVHHPGVQDQVEHLDRVVLMDHQECRFKVEHLDLEMDHPGSAGSSGTSGAKWIIRKFSGSK
jgi:hypothetical protein